MDRIQNSLRFVRHAIVPAVVIVISSVALTAAADARGGHGGGHSGSGGGMHGAHFEGGGRRGNDPYIKAASDETDKLLNSKLKSICRGC